MKILMVGSGGREHALLWKMQRDEQEATFYITQGNGGTQGLAHAIPVAPTDVGGIVSFAVQEGIDLVVVGPEAPLARGLVDALEDKGLRAFGPRQAAAAIETSKSFAKDLMRKYDIPTAPYAVFRSPEEAAAYIRQRGAPIVVKADGLAAGKGSIVCRTVEEALAAVEDLMVRRLFGEAGRSVVVEDLLEGEELSFFALTDGERVLPLLPAQDHKRLLDGDRGPNTGGMGAYAPVSLADEPLRDRILREIMIPAVRALAGEGRVYRGLLYAGLMLTPEGPKVIEFNCRFGDPESQAVLPLLRSHLVSLLWGAAQGELPEAGLQWESKSSVCVVMASEGYPGDYALGREILIPLELAQEPGTIVFHAGTRFEGGRLLTDGGRVLGVTSWGSDIGQAIERAYEAVERIEFHGAQYRTDIGVRELRRVLGRRC